MIWLAFSRKSSRSITFLVLHFFKELKNYLIWFSQLIPRKRRLRRWQLILRKRRLWRRLLILGKQRLGWWWRNDDDETIVPREIQKQLLTCMENCLVPDIKKYLESDYPKIGRIPIQNFPFQKFNLFRMSF